MATARLTQQLAGSMIGCGWRLARGRPMGAGEPGREWASGERAARGRRGRSGPRADQVFISYRRADSGGWGRVSTMALSIGWGRAGRSATSRWRAIDFRQHLDRVLDRCDVLLAVIGQRWTSIGDAEGNRRLDEPDDLVRREIARALERPDVQVIPVLVDGAQRPKENELPPELTSLSRRNACKLVDERWEYDVDRLTKRLRDLLGDQRPVTWRHVRGGRWRGCRARRVGQRAANRAASRRPLGG